MAVWIVHSFAEMSAIVTVLGLLVCLLCRLSVVCYKVGGHGCVVMLVSDARGDHEVGAYSRGGLMTAL